jgi:hypothetical protein
MSYADDLRDFAAFLERTPLAVVAKGLKVHDWLLPCDCADVSEVRITRDHRILFLCMLATVAEERGDPPDYPSHAETCSEKP